MNADLHADDVPPQVRELLTRLRSPDDAVRVTALEGARPLGAPAVRLLVEGMSDGDPEAARAAKRALWNLVRHAGRPGAAAEAMAVEQALIALPRGDSMALRREILWMLSEIGGAESVRYLAGLLGDPVLREDARCALQRIPGPGALAALRHALAAADAGFAVALAEALRARGERVLEPPSRKRQPSRRTSVGV